MNTLYLCDTCDKKFTSKASLWGHYVKCKSSEQFYSIYENTNVLHETNINININNEEILCEDKNLNDDYE